MIPTSAVRETLILILFGIILVPIAAKRAQDARGYWQTFQLQDLAVAAAAATTTPSFSSSCSSSHHHAAPLVMAPAIIHNAMAIAQQNDSSMPAVVYATSSAPRTETRTGLTIRFGSATAAMATAAPSIPQHQHQQQKSPQGQTKEFPTAAKMSDASKGRWTLIWMGSAIAAVAVFMSLC